MWTARPADSSWCKDNVRDVVSDVKALNKIAVWIPVENDNSPEQGVYERSFTKMDNCESHIDFTTIAPQPHYYQVTNTSPPDGYRPGGMTYNDLKAFKASCKSRGWGVEFECDTAAGGTDENCGCVTGVPCVKRAANYYCAADAEGPFTYIHHNMSTERGHITW